MEHREGSVRLAAVLLALCGSLGLMVTAKLGLERFPSPAIWWLVTFIVLAYGSALYAGIGLWRGTPRGWTWAQWVLASQIPIVLLPGVEYSWFTGLQLGPTLEYGSDALLGLALGAGANAGFSLGDTRGTGSVGINLCAAWLLYRVAWARPALPTPRPAYPAQPPGNGASMP